MVRCGSGSLSLSTARHPGRHRLPLDLAAGGLDGAQRWRAAISGPMPSPSISETGGRARPAVALDSGSSLARSGTSAPDRVVSTMTRRPRTSHRVRDQAVLAATSRARRSSASKRQPWRAQTIAPRSTSPSARSAPWCRQRRWAANSCVADAVEDHLDAADRDRDDARPVPDVATALATGAANVMSAISYSFSLL